MGKTVVGIVVPLEEYIQLRKRDLKLDYLECGGVDNWCNYGEALNEPEEDEDDFLPYCEQSKKLESELREKYKNNYVE